MDGQVPPPMPAEEGPDEASSERPTAPASEPGEGLPPSEPPPEKGQMPDAHTTATELAPEDVEPDETAISTPPSVCATSTTTSGVAGQAREDSTGESYHQDCLHCRSIGLLSFLSFSNLSNRVWHSIIARNWLNNSITIPSEILKRTIEFQAGIVAAMLAALALEHFQVSLGDTVELSNATSDYASGKLYIMLFKSLKTLKSRSFANINYLLYVGAVTAFLIFDQVITILLVADIGLATVAGPCQDQSTAFGFKYRYVNYSNIPQPDTLN